MPIKNNVKYLYTIYIKNILQLLFTYDTLFWQFNYGGFMIRIRNWGKFQHFKNKASMVWFKVYGRDIINDPDWHDLDSEQKSTLFEFWCLASEKNGELPELRKICFRLHKNEEYIMSMINSLDRWLDCDLDDSIYTEYTKYAREESREEEKRENDMRKDKKIEEKKRSFIKDIS